MSGGPSSRRSRRSAVTRTPFARALRSMAATAKASMSIAGRFGRAGPHGGDGAQPGARREVDDAPARDGLRVIGEVARDRQPAAPRERPVGEGGVRIAGLDLDGVPQRQDLVTEVETDASMPGTGPRRVWRRTKARGDAAIRYPTRKPMVSAMTAAWS